MKKTLTWLQPLHDWDTRLFLRVNHRIADSRWLHRSALWLSHSGSGLPYALFALLAFWLDDRHGTRFATLLACGYAVERPLYWFLKNSIRRRRPFEAIAGWQSLIVPSDRFSFPSGHTSGAFLFLAAVALCYPVLLPLALPWALCVGSSRVVLGVHFPGDIVAGSLMGTACAWIAQAWIG